MPGRGGCRTTPPEWPDGARLFVRRHCAPPLRHRVARHRTRLPYSARASSALHLARRLPLCSSTLAPPARAPHSDGLPACTPSARATGRAFDRVEADDGVQAEALSATGWCLRRTDARRVGWHEAGRTRICGARIGRARSRGMRPGAIETRVDLVGRVATRTEVAARGRARAGGAIVRRRDGTGFRVQSVGSVARFGHASVRHRPTACAGVILAGERARGGSEEDQRQAAHGDKIGKFYARQDLERPALSRLALSLLITGSP